MYEVTGINHVKKCTEYIFDISLNNYDSHMANVAHTVNMLNRHIDTTCVHMYAQLQPSASSTSQYYKYALKTYG